MISKGKSKQRRMLKRKMEIRKMMARRIRNPRRKGSREERRGKTPGSTRRIISSRSFLINSIRKK